MITVRPIRRALVPNDSKAASRVSGPNYDEFQSDREVWDLIVDEPHNVLRITMPHCDSPDPNAFLKEGSAEALERAGENLAKLRESGPVREVENSMWVYSIEKDGKAQTGLGCMALTGEIRTEATPEGTIVRNEGIREPKAKGRADLIEATQTFIGCVNNTVEDVSGRFASALAEVTDARPCDYEVVDEAGSTHRVWLVTDRETTDGFQSVLAAEPYAYVADGNHRSAAAAMLGHQEFLNVIFPIEQMGIAPYNRLVKTDVSANDIKSRITERFDVDPIEGVGYEPDAVHDIGLLCDGQWFRLRPKTGTFDPTNAAEDIDADIVQRHLFAGVLGIEDPKDDRLNFVGGNKPVSYLEERVAGGEYELAVTLAPVTKDQFMDVCRQNRFMPPKSTWFDPKVRSGLVIALLAE
ncbi:MAG: DUF1015 family protein [Planctomycetota bacterium]